MVQHTFKTLPDTEAAKRLVRRAFKAAQEIEVANPGYRLSTIHLYPDLGVTFKSEAGEMTVWLDSVLPERCPHPRLSFKPGVAFGVCRDCGAEVSSDYAQALQIRIKCPQCQRINVSDSCPFCGTLSVGARQGVREG